MKFLVCDDHALLREAIAETLQDGFPGCQTREASDFVEAWAQARNFAPDLAVCDLMMPGAEPMPGLQALLDIMQDRPILVLTGNEDDQLMMQLLDRGVAGFAGKQASSAVIVAAVQLLLAGGRYLPPRLLKLVGTTPAGQPDVPFEPPHLTTQQRRVLSLAAEGKQTKVIAQELGVAPSTVKSHLEYAMRQLGASNRIEACRKAANLGLL